MRLRIDYDRCSGHGRCYATAPELFADDEAGYGQVIMEEIDEAHHAAAELAVAACPEHAIMLEDG